MYAIRSYYDKNELRNKFKQKRKELSDNDKSTLDNKILNKLLSEKVFFDCETVLTYISTEIEVDTIEFIKHCLEIGKKVAVPKCINGTRQMDFYLINSLDDLEKATFSVLEPKANKCSKLTDYSNSICIIPGLVFDLKGYRLGYGKGYYDRFLSYYDGIKVGLCYSFCIISKLIKGKFDKSVDILITDKIVKKIH